MAVAAISSDALDKDDSCAAKQNVTQGEVEIQTKAVGVTALAASILDQNGIIDDMVEMFISSLSK